MPIGRPDGQPGDSMRCAMSILACPADADYVRKITAHLKRAANFKFAETFLVLDTMRHDQAEPLIAVARSMQEANEIDRYVELETHLNTQIARKHFLERPRRLRDNRDIPLFGWITGIESAATEYVFHADCDILIHSKPVFSWVEEAILLMENDPSVLFVSPHPGPPSPEGIFRHDPPPIVDEHENYRFKSFSSRRYLVNKKRFEQLLPLRSMHVSWRRKLAMHLGGSSSILPWETHVDWALRSSPFFRVHLRDTRAWALHCPDHGNLWRQNIAKLIAAVEDGAFPSSQAGHYDLILEDWLGTIIPSIQPALAG
jgi:hypothetical protein